MNICIYHKSDLDGICSAAIVKKFIPDCQLIGTDYDDDFALCMTQEMKNTNIYVVDFSFPISIMYQMQYYANNLIWIDHHISAMTDAEKEKFVCRGIRLVGKAACELTWEWFSHEMIPHAVYLLGRYDVWDLSPRVINFQLGMKSLPDMSPIHEIWNDLLQADSDTVINRLKRAGSTIHRYLAVQEKRILDSVFEITFEGLRTIAANTPQTQNLDLAYYPHKHDLMLSFIYRNGQWNVSLRCKKPEVDCASIAKKYGGGGHRQAAGFQTKTLFFLQEVTD